MTLGPPAAVALGWALMALVMLALWEVQRRRGDASIVDVAWTAGLGLLALLYVARAAGRRVGGACWWRSWRCSGRGGWRCTCSRTA